MEQVVAVMGQATLSMRRFPIHLIFRRNVHHARASGYDRIADYIDGHHLEAMHSNRIPFVTSRLSSRLAARSGMTWYNPKDAATEMLAMRVGVLRGHQLFHVLYGENSYRYLGLVEGLRGNRVVATYHLPPSRLYDIHQNLDHVRRLTAVLVVARVQVDFFASFLGDDKRVFAVPHGIDTAFFVPDDGAEKDIDCLFVGHWLRDFDTLHRTVRILHKARRNIRIVIVSTKEHRERFADIPRVEFLCGIPDEALRSCYQRARLLLLPLLDCTANNALLEAMACGLPVVSTDLPGVREYVGDKCALLAPPGDSDTLAEHALDLLNHPATLDAMSAAARQQAARFVWERIAAQVQAVYWAIEESG